jgi:hypothetical protein
MASKSVLAAASIAVAISVVASAPSQAQSARQIEMAELHKKCEQGRSRRACIRFGILIGENRQRHTDWRKLHPDWWWWEKS